MSANRDPSMSAGTAQSSALITTTTTTGSSGHTAAAATAVSTGAAAESLERSLAALTAHCNFAEASLGNISKQVRMYAAKQKELSLVTADLVRIFREISAVEPDDGLRLEVETAAAHLSSLHGRADVFLGAEEAASQIADEAKALAVQPLRDFIEDARGTVADVRQAVAKQMPPSSSSGSSSGSSRDKAAAVATLVPMDPKHTMALQRLEKLSNVHGSLFEKHRVRYLRAALRGLVHAKLQFHCRAVEELSAIHEVLCREDVE